MLPSKVVQVLNFKYCGVSLPRNSTPIVIGQRVQFGQSQFAGEKAATFKIQAQQTIEKLMMVVVVMLFSHTSFNDITVVVVVVVVVVVGVVKVR